MKKSEKEIINYLRKGKKANISEIARELSLPVSTVRDRIKKIERNYVIKRASLLDYSRLGYNSNAMLAMKIHSKKKSEFLVFLKKQNCVNSIHHTNSGFNFLVEIVCKDNLELRNWIEDAKIKFPVKIMLFQILKTEEKEKFVPENG